MLVTSLANRFFFSFLISILAIFSNYLVFVNCFPQSRFYLFFFVADYLLLRSNKIVRENLLSQQGLVSNALASSPARLLPLLKFWRAVL